MKKILIIIGLILIAVLSDWHFANGSYIRLLSGWSYLGWLSIFLVCLWLLRSWLRAFASILLVSVFQDIGLQLLTHHPFYPYPITQNTSQIYGQWATFLNHTWLGFPNGYFLASGLAVILLIIAWRIDKKRAN